MNIAYNRDCMEAMREYPDKYFDLAVVDPPYGINRFKNAANSRLRKYGPLETVNDMRPNKEYFMQLFRISKNQIVWGYNHLSDLLPPTSEFLFWYKHNPVKHYSDGELAWTSYKKTAHCIDYPYFGTVNAEANRIHPTQKPVALYSWIYQNYAKPGYKILDTHLGSGSSRIAAYELGLDFTGFEIHKEYFDLQEARFQQHTAQASLFHNSF